MPNEQRDTRIVEMHFENRQFERNIAKSQKSLEDFKKELNFKETSRGLQKFFSDFDSVNFQHLSSNIQALTDKFTGLGNASEWVLSRIRHGLESTALQLERFVTSFTTEQIKIGQSKYDAMNKAAMSLISAGTAEDEAYSVFDRIMEYTDQTSANFENMTMNLQSFTSSGKGLWESEKALEGIFNMTAKAGKGATEASYAMNAFSKAMGVGYLDSNRWESLTLSSKITTKEFKEELINAGLAMKNLERKQNGQIVTAKKYGKQVEVTVGNVQNTLNKKWADDSVMMALANRYYFDFNSEEADLESFAGTAYKCAQRALTFADAMQAIRESVSSGWMETFQLVFGRVTDSMEFFTNLCERVIEGIEGVKKARNEILRVWAANGGRQSIIDTILGDYGKDVATGAYGLLDLFNDVGSIISDGFWNMVKIFAAGYEQMNWDMPGYKEWWIGSKLGEFSKGLSDFMTSVRSFFTEEVKIGDTTKTRLQMIKDTIDGIAGIVAIAFQVLTGVFSFLANIKSQLQPSFDAIRNLFGSLGAAIYSSADEMNKSGTIISFFNNLATSATPVTSAINSLVQTIAGMITHFVEWGTQSGFFASSFGLISKAFEIVGKAIGTVGFPILDFFTNLFTIVTDLIKGKFGKEAFDKFGADLSALLKNSLNGIREFLKNTKIGPFIDNVWSKIEEFFSKVDLKDQLKSSAENVKNYFKTFSLSKFLNDARTKIFGFFKSIDIRKFFTDTYSKISAGLPAVIKSITDKFKSLFESGKGFWSDKSSIFTQIIDFFKNGFGSIGDFFKELNIGSLIERAFIGLRNTFSKVAGWFSDIDLSTVISAALGFLVQVEFFRMLRNIRASFGNIKKTTEYISTAVKDFTGGSTKFEDFADSLLKIAASVAIIAIAIYGLGSLDPKVLTQGGIAVAAIMAAVGLLMWRLSKNEITQDTAKAMYGLAAVIFMLSSAVKRIVKAVIPLSKLNWGEWIKAMGGLAIIMFGLTKVIKSLAGIKMGKKDLAGIAYIVLSIGFLILSIQPFAKMSWEGIAKSLGGLIAVLGVLMLFAWGLKKLKISKAQLKGISDIAKAVGILVLSVVPFAFMTWTAFARSLIGLLAVLGLLIAFAEGVKLLKISSVQLLGITGLATGIALMALALIPLALMSWPAMIKALTGMLIMMGILTLVSFAISKLNLSTVKLTGVIGLAAGVAILTLALLPIAFMPTEKLKQALLGLLGMCSILVLFFLAIGALQKVFGVLGTLQTVIASLALAAVMAVAMFVLSKALNRIKDIPSDKITAFASALMVILVSVTACIALMSMIPLAMGIKGILMIAAGIIVIAGALAVAIPMLVGAVGNSLMDFSSKLSLISSMLGDFSSRMSGVDESGIDKAGSIFDKLKALMGRLTGFGSYAKDINDFSIALFDLSTGLEIFQNHTKGLMDPAGSNAFKMVDKVLSYGTTLSAFAIGSFSSEIYRLGLGLYAFDYIGSDMSDPSQSKPIALLNQLAAAAPNIALLSSLQTSNLQSSLAGLGGALSLYAAGAKEATGIEPGEMTNTEGAVAILNAVVDSLVKNGGIQIPELPDETSLGLFGSQLAALASAIVRFSTASNGLGEGTDKAIQLLDFIGGDLKAKLTADNLAVATAFKDAGITPYGLAEFALDIIGLGTAISSFVTSTSGITTEGMSTAFQALSFFARLKTLFTQQDAIVGVLNFFTGNNITLQSLTDFGFSIEQLGLALNSFATSVTWGEEQEGSFQQALDALDFLVSLETTMPTVGGVVSFFKGQKKDLGDLASETEALGTALADFNSKLVDEAGNPLINQTAINGAITALDSITGFLSDLGIKMPGIPGLIEQVFTGSSYNAEQLKTDVGNFKSAIIELGKLSKYVAGDDENGTTLISADDLTAPIDALDLIMDFTLSLSGKMPTVGGYIHDIGAAFTGENYNLTNLQTSVSNFKDVCGELALLSSYLIGGEGETKVIDTDKFTETTNVLDALTTFSLELSAKMGTVGGLGEAFKSAFVGKNYSLTNLGDDLKGLGEGLGAFSSGLGTGFDPTKATAAVGVAESIADILTALHSIGDGSYFDVTQYTESMRQLLDMFNGTGYWAETTGFAEGIINLMATVSEAYSKYTVDDASITAFAAMARALKDVATIDPSFNFESVGMSIGTGIAVGIQKSTSSITTAAKNAAIAAYNAAMAALDAHSPSKLFMDVGGFITAGMAIGINNGTNDVRNSAVVMSEEAVNGAATVLSIISDLMDENLDANPTISPVLDLTNMQAGMSTMDQWLAEDRGMSIDTSVAGRMASRYMPNTTTPEINQNGTDYSGIYEHMMTLGEQIGALGEQIAKMQIVLDTGVVAGGVAPDVDKYIGDQMFYGERGN